MLCVQVFAKAEVFVEAESVRLLVSPEIFLLLALFNRPDGVLPFVAVGKFMSLDNAAAWKADEARVHGVEHVHKILAEPVRFILIKLSPEKGDKINVNCSRLVSVQPERAFLCVCNRNDVKSKFLPFFGDAGDLCFIE